MEGENMLTSYRVFLVLVISFGFASSSHAGFFDAVTDIASFGQVGRERDRTRAEMQLLIELEKQLAAERERKARMDVIFKENAILQGNINALKEIQTGLSLMSALTESHRSMMTNIFLILKKYNVEAEAFRDLIVLQQQELLEYLEKVKTVDKETSYVSITQKIELHVDQIEQFPGGELTSEAIDQMIIDAFASISTFEELIKKSKNIVEARIKSVQKQIDSNKDRHNNLSKPVEPKKVMNIGSKNPELNRMIGACMRGANASRQRCYSLQPL